MKRQFHFTACLLGTLLLASASLQAQNESSKKSILNVSAGSSWYVGRLMGITDHADSYRSDLRKGISHKQATGMPGKATDTKGRP